LTVAILAWLWSGTPSPLALAQRHGVPALLVGALAWRESRCRDGLVSRRGAVGPLQVMPAWLRRPPCLGLGALECGVALLALGRATCGGWRRALGWYHAGRCGVTRHSEAVWRDYVAMTRRTVT
jgi:hypothetical protein